MYVYIRSEPGLWTVGHYAPEGKFEPESDHASTEAAAERVRYLNGWGVSGEVPVQEVVRVELPLRDWYAGQALAGYLAAHAGDIPWPTPEEAARKAFQYADAMIQSAKGRA